jgi:uncharacterized protein (DUF362 family)
MKSCRKKEAEKRTPSKKHVTRLSRRTFLKYAAVGGIAAAFPIFLRKTFGHLHHRTETVIASATGYHADLMQILRTGLLSLSLSPSDFKGKRILIKPNLVEPHAGFEHINTHPLLVRAVVELFRRMDAAEVIVAEGAGHRRDSLLVIEESGFADFLHEDRIPFIDLNTEPVQKVTNKGGYTSLKNLFLPQKILQADILVSLAKMKTHHWAGVTLSMKNLFGIMPGCVYGWPKNVLHQEGIGRSILDINTTISPHLSIVDGIIGMEGDGPIMGTPVESNVLVMGTNSPAVDATCARIMGIDPLKIPYLKAARRSIGPISSDLISQRGATIQAVQNKYKLIPEIPAQRDIRL